MILKIFKNVADYSIWFRESYYIFSVFSSIWWIWNDKKSILQKL